MCQIADYRGLTIPTAAGDLREFPISTISLLGQNFPVGGGGYFRLLPYPLIRYAIRCINARNQSAVFYLHPYELDTEELRHPLPNESRKTRLARLEPGAGPGEGGGETAPTVGRFRVGVGERVAGSASVSRRAHDVGIPSSFCLVNRASLVRVARRRPEPVEGFMMSKE